MITIVGTDENGVIRLISNADNASYMPVGFNGLKITAHILDAAEEKAFNALPSNRGGTMFDGINFTALPADPLVAPIPDPIDELRTALLADPTIINKVKNLK